MDSSVQVFILYFITGHLLFLSYYRNSASILQYITVP